MKVFSLQESPPKRCKDKHLKLLKQKSGITYTPMNLPPGRDQITTEWKGSRAACFLSPNKIVPKSKSIEVINI